MKNILVCLALQLFLTNVVVAEGLAAGENPSIKKTVTVQYEDLGIAKVELTYDGEIFVTPQLNKDQVKNFGPFSLEKTVETSLRIGRFDQIIEARKSGYYPLGLVAKELFVFQDQVFAVVESRYDDKGINSGPFLLNIKIQKGQRKSAGDWARGLGWNGLMTSVGLFMQYQGIQEPSFTSALLVTIGAFVAIDGIAQIANLWAKECRAHTNTCAVGSSPSELLNYLGALLKKDGEGEVDDILLSNPKNKGQIISLAALVKSQSCEQYLLNPMN